jgi:hypothetical protein
MCGWFYDIRTSLISGIYGDKIWVVLNDKKLEIYNNPYGNELKDVIFALFNHHHISHYILIQLFSIFKIMIHFQTIDCMHICDIVECEYDKLEIKVEGLTIKLVKVSEYYMIIIL